MTLILFYEKPGCVTNAKQKKILKESGCLVITRNLLELQMSQEELFSYLKDKPLGEWFNPNAPKMKSKQIDPSALSTQSALALLLRDPILIRRPLLNINGQHLCGFDKKMIEDALGMKLMHEATQTCSSLHPCPSPITPTALE